MHNDQASYYRRWARRNEDRLKANQDRFRVRHHFRIVNKMRKWRVKNKLALRKYHRSYYHNFRKFGLHKRD